ncbi:hypothetical protein MOQ72_38060 [Saccharopolyspora sp. K220]|uniref:hypothetical protein n=1 Tax=Saccharopolyspora soli TaxID=2926618 RepID=UPI001F57E29D|nr:hypothetical protein [Saccharopolyspora soli]MCI2423241.1 hypothetical protein [Saccharopolyspora soli]
MSEPSNSSRPASPWTSRDVVWVLGWLITLVAGTLVVGFVIGLVLPPLFGVDQTVLVSFGTGFILSAGYVGWRVARAVRRGRRG